MREKLYSNRELSAAVGPRDGHADEDGNSLGPLRRHDGPEYSEVQHILEGKLDPCERLAALFADEALAVPRLAFEGHAPTRQSLRTMPFEDCTSTIQNSSY